MLLWLGKLKKLVGTVLHKFKFIWQKSLIPAAGILLVIQGISEVFRSIICIQTGHWPARMVVAEETEQVLMRQSKSGGTKRCCLV